MSKLSGLAGSAKKTVAGVRARRPFVDHLVRAFSRYQSDTGDRLAASVTFYGFLSFFPLVALAFSVLGYVLNNNPDAQREVQDRIASYLPGLIGEGPGKINLTQIAAARQGAGVAGLVGLLFAGLGWVDALRESIRSIWHQNVKAGNIVTRKLIDIGVLAGLGVVLGASIAVSGLTTAATKFVLDLLGIDKSILATVGTRVLGIGLLLFVDTVLFLYLFVRLPRVQTPLRRVIKGAVFAAIGFEVIKILGAFYIARTTKNPIYGTFAVVVGLLVWINVVSRFLLFTAAWTVTAPYDTDVAPSGTASPEAARKAGIPEEYADQDPGDPKGLQEDGAPTPLVAAVAGRTPPQDEPEGAGARDEGRVSAGNAGVPNPGRPDAGKPDAGKPDAGKLDAGRPDPGRPGSGRPGSGRPGRDGSDRDATVARVGVGALALGAAVYGLRAFRGRTSGS